MQVKNAEKSDIPGIFDLLQEAGNAIGNYGSTYTKEDLDSVVGNPNCLIYLAIELEKVVGILIAYDLICCGYIDVLYVPQSQRNKNIAGQLYKKLEAEKLERWRTLEFCVPTEECIRSGWANRVGYKLKEPVRWAVKEF